MKKYIVIGTEKNDDAIYFSGKVHKSEYLAIAELAKIAATYEQKYDVDFSQDMRTLLITEFDLVSHLIYIYKIFEFEDIN